MKFPIRFFLKNIGGGENGNKFDLLMRYFDINKKTSRQTFQ